MKVKLEDDGEDNSELIEEIEDSFIEEYIPLPGQYEINEYRIIDLANAQDIWEDKILPLTAKEHDILLDCYRTKLRYSYWVSNRWMSVRRMMRVVLWQRRRLKRQCPR